MAEFPFKVKALFNYTSPHDDDLNFTGGQVITVTDEEDTEWYYGEYVDQSGARKEGMFPRNFVDRVEPDAPPRPARSHRARKSASGIQPPSAPALGESTTTATDIPPEPVLASHADDDARPPDRVAKAKELPLASGQLQPLPTASTPDMEPIPLPLHRTSSLTKAPPSAAAAAKPGTNTFKDRIAAFNKPAAPPIAPFKPASLSSGSSGFVKKPYVPPPPSRDAYIPPPREPAPSSYRREDDTGTEPFASEGTRLVDAAPELEPDAEDEIQVQPTSLKERIALLQKQQLENAMRHSDTAQRKEHGKKPTRQLTGTPDVFDKEDVGGGAAATGTDAGDRDESSDKIPGHERPSLSSGLKLAEPAIPHQAPIAPSQEVFSDANDADQSGFDEMAEDVEENLTDHNKPDRAAAFPVPMRPAAEPSSPRRQGTQNSEKETRQDEEDQDAGVRDPEMDPEIKRRMELRERMAKMSGGMAGFASHND
ncbi:MAG: hypothetical protein M1826_003262 [Phylliscum demangeonii]|nr:MAG: hypothetical protein M1826_003262 [Phylliscum demangeonii]